MQGIYVLKEKGKMPHSLGPCSSSEDLQRYWVLYKGPGGISLTLSVQIYQIYASTYCVPLLISNTDFCGL